MLACGCACYWQAALMSLLHADSLAELEDAQGADMSNPGFGLVALITRQLQAGQLPGSSSAAMFALASGVWAARHNAQVNSGASDLPLVLSGLLPSTEAVLLR